MNSTYKYLLEFLKLAIHDYTLVYDKEFSEDLNLKELYDLCKLHNIVALVYEGIIKIDSFSIDKKLMKLWNDESINIELKQIKKSINFLDVYNKLLDVGIKPIVVKGISCREIYPVPDSRISSDEDILIKEEDFYLVNKIFEENNLVNFKNETFKYNDVVTYFNFNSGLAIEVHKTLFNKDKDSHLNLFNKFYENCFDKCIEINIQNNVVYTLPHTMNLLYLISHTAKHFLHGGVGIRQVCDIIKFIEVNNRDIDWDYLWNSLKEIRYDYFVFSLINIGSLYLGLDESIIKYPEWYDKNEIDCCALLEDILDAGIYGKSTIERKQSSFITSSAVDNRDKKYVVGRFSSFLFPKCKVLRQRYKYLIKRPYLLPIAWIHRILHHTKEKILAKNLTKSLYKSVSIGNKRIELLKQYNII